MALHVTLNVRLTLRMTSTEVSDMVCTTDQGRTANIHCQFTRRDQTTARYHTSYQLLHVLDFPTHWPGVVVFSSACWRSANIAC